MTKYGYSGRSVNDLTASEDLTLLERLARKDSVAVPKALLDDDDPNREQTAKLVQHLFAQADSHSLRIVVFSSADQECGANEICFRAARLLAAQHLGSVCVVDANLRAASSSDSQGLDKLPGFADCLLNAEPCKNIAIEIITDSLWFVPPGIGGSFSGFFGAECLCQRLTELRRAFKFVLVNAPPVIAYPDALRLGEQSDGLVLVLEANSTRREVARRTKETLEAAKVNIVGAVLNNRTFPIPESIYRRF